MQHDNARWLLARKRLLNEADTVANAPKRKKEFASRFYSKRGGHTIINFPDVRGTCLLCMAGDAFVVQILLLVLSSVQGAYAMLLTMRLLH
jgi:hypothetical protein